MAQQFITSSGAAVGPRIQEIDQTGVVVQRPVGYWRYVSWGAIFAGAVLALSTQLLLTLLGSGIGLVALGNTANASDSDTATGFGIGAAVWWLITSLISLFVGGLAAGRLARVSQSTDGIFHGLLVWSVATIFSVYLLTTAAASLIGGTYQTLNSYIESGRPIPGVDQPTGATGQPTTAERIAGAVGANQQQPAAGGQRAPDTTQPGTTERAGGEQMTAREREQTEEQAKETASDVGKAALWSFFALALGAVSAALGGSLGRHVFSRFDEPTTVVSRTPMAPDNPQRTSE